MVVRVALQARQSAADRVVVAAEVAQLYVAHRLCRAQLAVASSDRDSRGATARSSAVTASSGSALLG